MAVIRRGNKLVIDYWPDGRRGKRKRVTLPEYVQDEADAREMERAWKEILGNPA
jgi:hypothetical protein